MQFVCAAAASHKARVVGEKGKMLILYTANSVLGGGLYESAEPVRV